MHAALKDIRVERLYVIYPGRERYALHAHVEALPFADMPNLEL